MSPTDAQKFLTALLAELFHADVLTTEQAERIDGLEAENASPAPAPTPPTSSTPRRSRRLPTPLTTSRRAKPAKPALGAYRRKAS